MTETLEHRPLEEIKKDLIADAGSNVILAWKDAIFVASYIRALEESVVKLEQRVKDAESLLSQINEQLSGQLKGE